MTGNLRSNNIDTIYPKILSDIKNHGFETDMITDPLSVGSKFGKNSRSTKELLAYQFSLTDPRSRIITNNIRNINLPFAISNFIWNLGASDCLEKIAYFNRLGNSFSDNGKTIHGSCYGKRLLNINGMDQIKEIINQIRKDPASRRTFAPIFYPNDNFVDTKDMPCPIGVQYFLRNERLHAITYMRSNSAAFVLPYNIFFFTMLHELITRELNVELGDYIHICGSLHYYKDEEPLVDKIIETNIPSEVKPMEPMPQENITDNIQQLVTFQDELVNQTAAKLDISYWMEKADSLERYWKNFAIVITCHTLEKKNQFEEYTSLVKELKPEYQRIMNKAMITT